MSELLEVQEVKRLVDEIIFANPDTENPYDPGLVSCVYTDEHDPNRHCIVGQLAADMGWIMPDEDCVDTAEVVAAVYGWPITEHAATYLTNLQVQADSNSGEVRWRELDTSI